MIYRVTRKDDPVVWFFRSLGDALVHMVRYGGNWLVRRVR